MNIPLVSVCMITYNHEKHISEAMEGVLEQQTNFNVEFIICNDNSTDGTNTIISNRIEDSKKKNVHYYSHSENMGMMPNFIFALNQCKGKYIALCEGDDYWTDSLKLQKQVDFLTNNPDYVACFTNIDLLTNTGFTYGCLKEKHKRDYDKKSILDGFWIPTLTVMLRKSALPAPFPQQFFIVPNGDVFLFHLLSREGKIGYLDFVSGVYRKHSGGIWTSSHFLSQNNSMALTLRLLKEYFKNEAEMVYVFNERLKKIQQKKITYHIKKRSMYSFTKEFLLFFVRHPLETLKWVFLELKRKIKT